MPALQKREARWIWRRRSGLEPLPLKPPLVAPPILSPNQHAHHSPPPHFVKGFRQTFSGGGRLFTGGGRRDG